MMTTSKKIGLELLREQFPEHQISKLPKPTKAQTDEVKNDYKAGFRCNICGGWHHPKVLHLDYVGHAALTDRLLDCDINWTWEALALNQNGLPAIDADGGLWIKLTVCGVTRLGYGDAQNKVGGDAMKERIGDALRNAAMRFGAALDLWHKGDLHIDSSEPVKEVITKPELKSVQLSDFSEEEQTFLKDTAIEIIGFVETGNDLAAFNLTVNLDNDEKSALWTLLDAKSRASLKKTAQSQQLKR